MERNNLFEEELNFRNIIKKPIRLFGWIFPFYLLLVLVLGIYFAQHLNTISFNQQPAGIQDTTILKKELVAKKGVIRKAIDSKLIKNPTAEMIAKGKKLYSNNCQSCHGEKGFGDGQAGIAMNPKPRNFHQKDGWVNGRTIDAMFKTLQEGISKSGMPAYDFISPEDRFNIIHYVRTFSDFPPITDEQLNSLNQQYKLDKDFNTPNQIPVTKAESLIVLENKSINDKINEALRKVYTDTNEGAKILSNYSYDLRKVLTTFNGFNSLEEFIYSVSKSPLTCGFKPSVVELSREDWGFLFNYLKRVTME